MAMVRVTAHRFRTSRDLENRPWTDRSRGELNVNTELIESVSGGRVIGNGSLDTLCTVIMQSGDMFGVSEKDARRLLGEE